VKEEVFFFEKKNQKIFAHLVTRPSPTWAADANRQKFFGSFFQKRTYLRSMQVLIKSNDPVRLSFLICLLRDAGIDCDVLDGQISAVEGSIGAFPRRLVVADDDASRARRVLSEAGET
jgi:hypothetical protein